jgi:hypothetical protein
MSYLTESREMEKGLFTCCTGAFLHIPNAHLIKEIA